ncbi:hypothetical protein Tco_0971493 [Tanacetum coccineum]
MSSKFATCTLQDDALTWWSAHVKTTTPEAAHSMPWATLKKTMTDKFWPVGLNSRCLRLRCGNLKNEIDKIEKYIGGLPDMITWHVQGHFKRNCLKLRNNDHGNQAGNDRAPAKVYVVGNAGANPDNVVAGTFLLNNRYAYIFFDTGADRSFVSTAFSSQIDITPSTLNHYYDVELADGRILVKHYP